MVRRKFDSTNPITWPDGHPNGKTAKVSQSLPELRKDQQTPGTADSNSTTRSHVKIIREISTSNGNAVQVAGEFYRCG